MNGIEEKGKGDQWMGFWRRERVTSGWECRESKGRCVDGNVEKGNGDVWIGWDCEEWKWRLVEGILEKEG